MAVGRAFESVEQHHQAGRLRIPGEVDVDEVAVGRVPAAALESCRRLRQQRRRDGLEVADQCSVLGGALRGVAGAAGAGCAGAGEA